MSKETECDIHNWFWAEDDEYGCPVCEGIAFERERIIALLEAERCNYLSCPDEDCHNCEMPINEVIALIKGENA